MTTVSLNLPGLTAYALMTKTSEKQLAQVKKDPTVTREIKYFEDKITKITKPDDLFKDRRLLNFVLKAYDLSGRADQIGLLKKALTQNRSDEKSLVNNLNDANLKQLANDIKLDSSGVDYIKITSVKADIVAKYTNASYEESLKSQNNALPDVVYFKRAISGASGSVYSILGDTKLRKVVMTTLGLPDTLAYQSVETQGRAITSRLDIAKFKDEKYVESFIKRYLVAADQKNTGTNSLANLPGGHVLNLFA